MLLAEEFLLLALDEESGKKIVSSEKIGPALGGAVLVELALLERIGVTPKSDGWNRRGRVTITSTKPTDDAELDAALRHLEEHEDTKVSTLLSDMSGKRITKGLQDRLLERLVRTGVLAETRTEVLGLKRWPLLDRGVEEELRRRLQSCLVGPSRPELVEGPRSSRPEPVEGPRSSRPDPSPELVEGSGEGPTERTVALVALLNATGHLTKVVHTEDKKALKQRAKELSEGDWAAAAVKQAIDEVHGSMAIVAGGAGNGGS